MIRAAKGDDGKPTELLCAANPPSGVSQRTEIVWQTAEGKRTPATLDDIKTAPTDVWINFPSLLSAGDSPVVPPTTMPSHPVVSRWPTRLASPGSLIVPSGCIGVTMATRLEPKSRSAGCCGSVMVRSCLGPISVVQRCFLANIA